jgi:hypothetical protein
MNNFYPLARLALLALAFLPILCHGQQERNLAPVSQTYAITNTTVFIAPGKKIEGGTVLIRKGLIAGVGRNLSVPSDAIVIRGDSLFVYAGFIDGFSHTGVTKPKEENPERLKDPGNPPPAKVGITPELHVTNFLDPADKTVEEMRAIGFTAAHVVPHGKMLPGYGAIILFNGAQNDKAILESKTSFYSELTPHERYYPNTIIGVLAKWRELYVQAQQAKAYETMYASNRTGLDRPVSDRTLQAFYPVIEKKVPVMFSAPRFLDGQRVLALQSEFGFPLIIGNLKEGWDLTAKIKSSRAKVFLSLDLPAEKKEDKKEDKKPAPLSESSDQSDLASGRHTTGHTENDKAPGDKTESELLEARRLEFMQKYVGLSATFARENIPFGFSANTAPTKDIHENLRRMIRAGLTEDQALAALTTHPAQMLGISDRLGTVEAGKIANLVISNKPYFSEQSKVRYVFVDGLLFKTEGDLPKKEAALPISGTWTLSFATPTGVSEEKVLIKKENDIYTATIVGKLNEEAKADSFEWKGKNLRFTYTTATDAGPSKRTVTVVLEKDTMKGNIEIDQVGTFELAGKKDPKF